MACYEYMATDVTEMLQRVKSNEVLRSLNAYSISLGVPDIIFLLVGQVCFTYHILNYISDLHEVCMKANSIYPCKTIDI